jgi:hypothetical protein
MRPASGTSSTTACRRRTTSVWFMTDSPRALPALTLGAVNISGTDPSRMGTIHLDLTAAPDVRAAEVERLTTLGAVRRWDVLGEVPSVDWTTMADPEDNLFCVAEHHPA